MSKGIVFEKAHLFGLTSSAIYINSRDIETNVSETFIQNCKASKGAGIYTVGKNINIDRLCVSNCYASSTGSSIYSECDNTLQRSTFCQSASDQIGADDNIDVTTGRVNFSEINVSYIKSKGATCCQFVTSPQTLFNRVINANCVSQNFGDSNFAKIFEILSVSVESKIQNSIFSNNEAYSIVEFSSSTGPVKFDNCYFTRNKLQIFARYRSGSVPKIYFSNVVMTDNINLGTNNLETLTSGEMPKSIAGYVTGDCFGYYTGKLVYGCLSTKSNKHPSQFLVTFLILVIEKN